MEEEDGEGPFSTPAGAGRKGVTDPSTRLESTLQDLNMSTVGALPHRTRQQVALEHALGPLGGGQRGTGGGIMLVADAEGVQHMNPSTSSIGGGLQGAPANIKLFRYDPANEPPFCGGLVGSPKKGPKRFCISSHCGLAHTKKVFDQLGEGDYYIIEPGARGGLSSTLRAYLEPSLPKAAAERSADNKEVLEGTNSMDGWLSLFRYLTDTADRGDVGVSKPALVGFASRARASPRSRLHCETIPSECERSLWDQTMRKDRPLSFRISKMLSWAFKGRWGFATRPHCTSRCTGGSGTSRKILGQYTKVWTHNSRPCWPATRWQWGPSSSRRPKPRRGVRR